MSTVHPLTNRPAPAAAVAAPKTAPLVAQAQAAEFLGFKPKTLAKDRYTREIGIPFIKLGKSVRYRMADLEKFVADRVVT